MYLSLKYSALRAMCSGIPRLEMYVSRIEWKIEWGEMQKGEVGRTRAPASFNVDERELYATML